MTPTPSQSQQMIRRVVAALRVGRVPAPEDAEWVADGLDFLLDAGSRGGTFARAFCLDGASAFMPARDRLIVAAIDEHFPGLSLPQAARAFRQEWEQYSRALLQHDLARGRCSDPPGTLRARLFEIAQLGQKVPKRSQLRNILLSAFTSH